MPLFVRTTKTGTTPSTSPRTVDPPRFFQLLLAAAFLLGAPLPRAAELAIVIDDVGYHLERARRLVDLPGPITLGMLPFAPHTPEIARAGAANNKEIILHLPMEPMPAAHVRAERGTLTLTMSPERFDAEFAQALARVPHAVGVNNHTGSLLTQHPAPMHRLMDNISRRGLFFLDSRTTPRTVAASTARARRVPTLSRDVFLDHDPSPDAIDAAFRHAVAVARRKGRAVLIGHPYRSTLAFLEAELRALPEDLELRSLGELLGPTSELFRRRGRTTLARLESPASPRRSPAR